MQENNTIKLHDERTLGYAEYGDKKGKPLFFFHGWPSSRLQAKILDRPAERLHVRIISIDRPGYGLSTYTNTRTLSSWSHDVIELADKLKIKKIAVMGVSGGGPYAASCAYAIPQRITKVAIVVGLGPTNIAGVLQGMKFVNRFLWRGYYTFPFLMQVSSSLMWLQARKHLPEYFSSAFRAKEDMKLLSKSSLAKDIKANQQEAFRQGKKGAAMDLKLFTNDWGFKLKDIKMEVFLWYGSVDKQVTVEMGKHYASQIKDSKLTIYPNEGHLLLANHAEEILKKLMTH